MRKATWKERLRYWFDNTIAGGPMALIGWLTVVSAVLILAVSLVVAFAHAAKDSSGKPLGLLEVIWMSFMRAIDSGTIAGDTGSFFFMTMMLIITLGGIFIVSTLIGILNTGIESKLDDLRKGRSFVVEKNHTVILGWSEHVSTIISELVIANENQPYSCVAILAEKDKVEMEDAIRANVGDTGKTRIVCRSGSPMDLTDLEIVNPHQSKSIIILAPEGGDPDAEVIKSILAITNNPNRRPEPYHIVAEIQDVKNMEVAKMVGRDEVELLLAGHLISQISVQTCRQSGLSIVYNELLDFGGDEIYFHREKGLAGKTFGEALLAYEDSALMGLEFADGRVVLKPAMDTVIHDGDRVIAISEDDDTLRLSGLKDTAINAKAIQQAVTQNAVPERTLIMGWNRWAPTIMQELDRYVVSGSELMIVADVDEAREEVAKIKKALQNQEVQFVHGAITDRQVLDGLDLRTYQHVIVLSYSDHLEPQKADAQTLITLLHLRDIEEKHGEAFSITSEMLNMRNRELAEITKADDFIVSEQLISLMMTQISENKDLAAVFADLFDSDGVELYLKPAADYVQPGTPVNFYTVMDAAKRRDEVAIGYRLSGRKNDSAYGVRVNPKKSEMITFSELDKVIVLAED